MQKRANLKFTIALYVDDTQLGNIKIQIRTLSLVVCTLGKVFLINTFY